MSLQDSILKQYMDLSKRPTLKAMSQEAGIQMTRLFRLINGSPMKLKEYEVLEQLVREKRGEQVGLEGLAAECIRLLSPASLGKIQITMERLLKMSALGNTQQPGFEARCLA